MSDGLEIAAQIVDHFYLTVPAEHEILRANTKALCLQIAAAIRGASCSPPMSDAVAAERERCAKICDGWIAAYGNGNVEYVPATEYASDAVQDIADAIRSGASAPSFPREEQQP